MEYEVRRDGDGWGVYRVTSGKLVEGNYTDRRCAQLDTDALNIATSSQRPELERFYDRF